MVMAGSSGGEYCADRSWKDGTAKNSSTTTGPIVQMTSISVLWLVRDGFGLALARYLTITQPSNSMTRTVIGRMNHSE
jgi:hypothetical protein